MINQRKKIFILFLIVVFLLTGCGREKVEYTTEGSSPALEQNEGLYISAENLGAAKKWEDRVWISEEDVVSISADVVVPDTPQMHIISARKKVYSPEEKKKILEEFAEGEIYCYIDEEENGENSDSEVGGEKGEQAYPIAEDFSGTEYVIRYLGVDYHVSLDNGFYWRPLNDYWPLASEEVKEALSSAKKLGIYGGDLKITPLNPTYETADNDCGISIAQAEEIVGDFLEKAGIWGFEPVQYSKLCWQEVDNLDLTGYMVGDTSKPTYGIEIELYRTIDQVSVDTGCHFELKSDGRGMPISYQESIILDVTEQGVISAGYYNMLEETGVEKGNVTLIAYDDACEAMRQAIEEHPERPSVDRYARFELLYYRMPDEEDADCYHIIPAWRLFSYDKLSANYISQSITINAIDGSYIDEDLEYLNMLEE